MTVFKKTFLSLGIAAIGFSAALAVFFLVFMNTLYYEINTTGLKNTAKTLYSAIGEGRISQLFFSYSELKNINEDSDVFEYHQTALRLEKYYLSNIVSDSSEYRLTLIEPSGNVIWDSHVTDLVNHIDREEVESALQGKEASARRNSISSGNKEIYYALPVFIDELPSGEFIFGVFRLSVSVPSFGVRVAPVIYPFLLFLFILIVLAFWGIDIYSRSLADSVGRLVKIAQSGAPFLSGPEAKELIAPEFRSLEKAMRAMTAELTMRFEQAKTESVKLEAILNGLSEAVFAMDSALKLSLVNPRARELFNLEDADARPLTLLEATHSAELEDFAKKALGAEAPLEMELSLRTSGYAEADKHFQVYAARISGGGKNSETNENSAVILALQDITRLVKLERVRKDFVANVSHELRTPIQLIKGFSETLLDAVTEAGGGKNQIIHFIEIIQKNAANMENLTNDLLILADLENSGDNSYRRNEREKEELFIAPLIDEAASSARPQAKKKNIEIIAECPDNLKANLYGSLIIQALINLIDNAVKYSPENSKTLVKAEIARDELVLEVRDNGIGIPKEHRERIFERFYRVDKARSKKEGGTGLGLSIVRHIALLHNGSAEMESRIGEGSIFRIRIPIR